MSPPTQRVLRDLCTGLSLANLCFIGIWAELFSLDGPSAYFSKAAAKDFVAVCLNVVLLGSTFGTGMTLVRRLDDARVRVAAHCAFLVALLIPLNRMRTQLPALAIGHVAAGVQRAPWLWIPLLTIAATTASYALVRWYRPVVRYSALSVLVLFPFTVLLFGRAAVAVSRWDVTGRFADRPTAPTLESVSDTGPRVVLLIFDELDQRLAFAERPGDLRLPEFDRLRAESVAAINAFPPGDHTQVSVPSLLSGRRVIGARTRGPAALEVTFEDSPGQVDWSTEHTIFSFARSQGRKAAIVGWYHPYCRLFAAAVARCFWEPAGDVNLRGQDRSLLQTALGQLRSLSPFNARQQHIDIYRRIVAEAIGAVADPTLGVVVVHLPVPHPPPIYDRKRRALSWTRFLHSGYLDNLALADVALGTLRRAMEERGLWSLSIVVVTSDHASRLARDIDGRSDPRVPLIVKPLGRPEPRSYARPINSVVVGALLRNALRGEIKSSADIEHSLAAAPLP